MNISTQTSWEEVEKKAPSIPGFTATRNLLTTVYYPAEPKTNSKPKSKVQLVNLTQDEVVETTVLVDTPEKPQIKVKVSTETITCMYTIWYIK